MSKRKRTINQFAQSTVEQVNSTLEMLQLQHLSVCYNSMTIPDYTSPDCQITWKNHVSDRSNAGESFTKLEQYLHILRNNSYHSLLFDGSLLRANFIFQNNILLSQNLLWWPAPYNYGNLLLDGYSPIQILDDFFSDPKWFDVIKMRSPIRIDFDSSINTLDHPSTHMHTQHEDCRMVIQQPICFNRFVNFIFSNYYPNLSISLSEFDYINYRIPDRDELEYITSTVIL